MNDALAIQIQRLRSIAAGVALYGAPDSEQRARQLLDVADKIEAAAQAQAAPDEGKPARLRELADRIDHETLWARAGMDRAGFTPEQCDRLDAGVELRRYASILKPGRWLVIPPEGPARFSAFTLDAAVDAAKKYYVATPPPRGNLPGLYLDSGEFVPAEELK